MESPSTKITVNENSEDLITDRVLIKRLFQKLDSDEDGLVSIKKINFTGIPFTIKEILEQYL